VSIGRVVGIDLPCGVPSIECEAICVRHWDWSETSQTVSLITRDHGLVRCLAKGSRREKAPFSGGLELATIGHMVSIVRPNSELVLLTSWDLTDPGYLIRADLDRYHAGMYAIDLIPRLVNDHDPHPELYDAIRQVIVALGSEVDCSAVRVASLLVWYQWVLLGSVGSAPELRADVADGTRLPAGRGVYGFDPRHGGFTRDPGMNERSDVWRVRSETLDLLRRLDEMGAEHGVGDASQEDLVRAGALLAMYIRTLVGHDVRSAHPIYPQTRASI
jgi:DNA repair protein RecO (recombination protein O)